MFRKHLNLLLILVFAQFFCGAVAYATEENAQSFTLDGRLFSDTAGTTPLTDTGTLKIQILDSTQACILYEETQNFNTTSSNGYFTVQVGEQTGLAAGVTKRTTGDSGHSMVQVFGNVGTAVSGKKVSDGTACSVTPAVHSTHYLRVVMTPSVDNSPRTLSPNMAMDSIPSAWLADRAESLQGVDASGFIKVNATANVTQTNIETLLNNYSNLATIAATPATSYVTKDSNSAITIPSITGTPASPQDGQMWYDNGVLKYWDATSSSAVTVGTSAGAASQWTTTGSDIYYTTGKVGIGTSAPNSSLDVEMNDANNIPMVLRNSNTGGFSEMDLLDSSGSDQGGIGWGNSTSATPNLMFIGTINAYPTTFWTNDTERMRIDSSGNVGIGTTAPGRALDVIGDIRAVGTGSTAIELKASDSGATGFWIRNDGSNTLVSTKTSGLYFGGGNFNLIQHFTSGTGSGELETMTLKTGNVGIGTTSPGARLEIASGTAGTSGLKFTNINSGTATSTGQAIGVDASGNVVTVATSGGGGTVTSVSSGTGLTGGPITGTGTLAVDVGTTASKIVQLDGSAKLPAVDGSALTALNASNLGSGTVPAARMPSLTGDVTSTAGAVATTLSKIQGTALTITTLTSGNYLKYNGTAWVNVTPSSADLSDASSLIKSSQMPSNCTSGSTLLFSSPTGTWTCTSIAIADSQITYASEAAGKVLAGPTTGSAAPTFRALTASDLPAGTTSQWTTTVNDIYYTTGKVGIGTVAPTATLDIKAGTVTTSTPALNITQTWNNSSTTFDAPIFENITNTASNSLSNIIDLQVDSTSKFTVSEAGLLTSAYAVVAGSGYVKGPFFVYNNGTVMSSPAVATTHLGAADAASAVAQTLGVQGVVGGTSNTAGANFVIAGSQGTGTGAGGSLVFQTAPAGSTGTTQNALVSAMTINSAGKVGIGTATPSTSLHIVGTSGNTLKIVDGNQGTGKVLTSDANGVASWATATGGTNLVVEPSTGSLIGGTTNASTVTTASLFNTVYGYQSLQSLTTGTYNTSVGYTALTSNTTGGGNTVIGTRAALSNVSGSVNVAIGEDSLASTSSGDGNTAIGHNAIRSGIGAYNSTAVGDSALYNITGNNNVGIGANSGSVITSGTNNTIIGTNVASGTLATGSNNIIIGAAGNVDTPAATTSNFLNIGNLIFATGMNGTVSSPAGNVGLGTTNPSTRLEITSASAGTSGLKLTNLTSATATSTGQAIGVDASGNVITVAAAGGSTQWSNGTASAIYYNSGNVGIGTATPGTVLDVVGDVRTSTAFYAPNSYINKVFTQSQSSTSPGFSFVYSSDTGMYEASTAGSHALGFSTAGVERIRVDSSGKVGIGSSTPTQTLDVNGNITATELCIGTDCRSAWPTAGTGSVTSVSSGTGLTGGPITTTGTLAVDVGTTASKIVQLDGSAKLPAVDGSALTALNASNLGSGTVPAARMPALTGDVTSTAGAVATTLSKIQGTTLTLTSLTTGDHLKYTGTAWVNAALSSADLSDASSLIKSSQMPSNCVAGSTLLFSSPTGTWTCTSIAIADSQITYASEAAGKVLAGPTTGSAAPTFRALVAGDLPAGTASQWTTTGSNIYYSTGSVGIGTTSPTSPLHVNYAGSDSSNPAFYIDTSSSSLSSSAAFQVRIPSSGNQKAFQIVKGSDTSSWASFEFNVGGAGLPGLGLGNGGSRDTLIYRNGASQLRTNSTLLVDGNVGIGTTSPAATFQVYKTAAIGTITSVGTAVTGSGTNFTSSLNVGDTVIAGSGYSSTVASIASDTSLTLSAAFTADVSATTWGRVGVMLNSGYVYMPTGVGIGTISPTNKLQVNGYANFSNSSTGENVYISSATSTIRNLTFRTDTSERWSVQTDNTAESGSNVGSNFRIRAKDDSGNLITDALFIQRSNGYVGIGTTTATTALQVNGTVTATAFSGPVTATTTSSGTGSNTTPSMTFSGDPDTGFYDASSNNVISVAAGGVKIWDLSSSGIVSPTTGGADITTAVGSATAPTYSFAGDTGTGWWRPAASTMAASTGGTERMRIDSSGNVGIGTTSPGKLLDVYASSGNTGNPTIQISGVANINYTGSSGYVGTLNFNNADSSNLGSAAAISATRGVSTLGSGELHFFTSAASATLSDRMMIDRNGNVGIGTTAPSTNLSVIGNTDLTYYGTSLYSSLYGRRAAGTAASPTAIPSGYTMFEVGAQGYNGSAFATGTQMLSKSTEAWSTSAQGSQLQFTTTTNGTTTPTARMTIDNAGNVGIGTTTPSSNLHVYSAPTGTAGFTPFLNEMYVANSSSSSNTFQGTSTNLYVQPAASAITGSVNGLNNFVENFSASTISNMKGSYSGVYEDNSSGTVTNAYGDDVEVNAYAGTITNAYGIRVAVNKNTGTVTNGYGIYISGVAGGATSKWSIYSGAAVPSYYAGSVGIGTAAPAYPLHVYTATASAVVASFQSGTGSCNVTPNTGMACSSDIRLKENIQIIPDALQKLNQLSGVTFQWKDRPANDQSRHMGFIAQEVEKIAPELVTQDTRGYKQVNYANFVAVLTQAVKEFFATWKADSQDLHQKYEDIQKQNSLKDQELALISQKLDQEKKRNDNLEQRLLKLEQRLPASTK